MLNSRVFHVLIAVTLVAGAVYASRRSQTHQIAQNGAVRCYPMPGQTLCVDLDHLHDTSFAQRWPVKG